jgi:hypothetical protein
MATQILPQSAARAIRPLIRLTLNQYGATACSEIFDPRQTTDRPFGIAPANSVHGQAGSFRDRLTCLNLAGPRGLECLVA